MMDARVKPAHDTSTTVVPAKAGTHSLRPRGDDRYCNMWDQVPGPVVMGPGVRRDDVAGVLTARRHTGSHHQMIQRILLTLAFAVLASPAAAVVGGGGAPSEQIARAVLTIIGSRGTFCSGTLIAEDIV